MTHDLGIENKVYFHGLLKDIKLRKIYNNSDIILLPSLSEGISNTAIESMSMGKILISSNSGGMPELIKDGVNGFIFKKYDIFDFVNKVDYIISNVDNFQSLRQNARAHVQQNYRIEAQIEKFEEVYKV
jgi:glycosyltransferase involved in cell wall biosynthesis